MIVSCSSDKTVILWNAKTGKKLRVFKGHTEQVYNCAFTPSGQSIISSGKDQTLIFWDISGKKNKQILTGHTETVNSFCFTPDDKRIISSANDKTVKYWSLNQQNYQNPVVIKNPTSLAKNRQRQKLKVRSSSYDSVRFSLDFVYLYI